MNNSIRNIILLLWFILYSLTAYTQNKTIDSLQKVSATEREDTNKVNTLINLSSEFDSIYDFKNCILYAKEALLIAEKLNFDRETSHAYYLISVSQFYQADSPEALDNISKALMIYQKIGSRFGIARCYRVIALIYQQQDNYPEELKNLYSALKIFEELGDKNNIANVLIQLGIVNEYQNNYSEALNNYFEALKISEEIGDKSLLYSTYWGIVDTKMSQETFESLTEALRFDSIALKISEELGDKYSISASYRHFGDIYLGLGWLFHGIKKKRKVQPFPVI